MKYTDQEAVDILAKLTEKTKFSSKQEQEVFKGLQKQVIKRCSWDLSFFFRNLIKVQDPVSEEYVPFRLKLGQRRLLAQMLRNKRSTGVFGWWIVSKARQQGITTFTNGMEVWRGFYQKNCSVGVTAQKEATTKKNLREIKKMIQMMPWWWKTACMEWDRGNTGRHFDSATQLSFKSQITDSEVMYTAFTSAAASSRGEAMTDLHWTEAAFCPEAKEMAKSILPILRRRKQSLLIVESTSNGSDNWYADTTLKAVAGSAGKIQPFFIPWYEDPDYKSPVPEGFELSDEESELKAEFDLTDEQLQFRKETIADYGGDITAFKQEYPSTVEESFVATDTIYFDQDIIEKVRELSSNVKGVERLHLSENGMSDREFGNFTVYRRPHEEHEYVIAADIANGQGQDYTVMMVMDPFGNCVAVLRDNQLRPDMAGSVLSHLGRWYNNAKILVERNGVGGFTIQALQGQLYYNNLYVDSDGRVGFRTKNDITKRRLMAQLQQAISDEVVTFTYPELAQEMSTFEIIDGVKLRAKDGFYDDLVDTAAMAVEIFHLHRPVFRDLEDSDSVPLVRKVTI